MNTITVTCGVCETILVTAEGSSLSQADANNYGQSTACNTDGQVDIQVVFTQD